MKLLKQIIVGLIMTGTINNLQSTSHSNSEANSRQKILEINFGHFVARALHVVAELKIADYLKESPKTIDELATLSNTEAIMLYRVLRVLVTHGVFDYTPDSKFKLNEISKLLLSNHPNSLRTAVAKELDTRRWNASGQLLKSIRTGKPAFDEEYGETFYEYLENDNNAKMRFDVGMSKYSEFEDETIAALFDFGQFSKVVDIGGNQGSLCSQILNKYQNVYTVLFDLPGTADNPKYLKENAAFNDRYEVVGGSFFETLPKGGDIYILKRVIHNWNDQDSIIILKNCASSMKPEGRILIIDCVEEPLSVNTKPSPLIDADINGIVLGGYERTKEEFEKLLVDSGLQLVTVHQSPSIRVKIIEAKIQ